MTTTPNNGKQRPVSYATSLTDEPGLNENGYRIVDESEMVVDSEGSEGDEDGDTRCICGRGGENYSFWGLSEPLSLTTRSTP